MSFKSIMIAAVLTGGFSIGTLSIGGQPSCNLDSQTYIAQQESEQKVQDNCNIKKWEVINLNKIQNFEKFFQELNNLLGNQQNNCPEINKPETNKPETNKPETNKPETNKPETNKPETNVEISKVIEEVAKLVNQERKKAGLPSLTLNVKACNAATIRAKETQQSFSHTRPNGKNFSTALKEANISFSGAGENIAWGQKTAQAVMKDWMNSPGHRANILNAKYTQIGIGYVLNDSGIPYWTQLFFYE